MTLPVIGYQTDVANLEPRWPYAYFGEGTYGGKIKMIYDKDDKGSKKTYMIIEHSKELRNKYKLSEEDLVDGHVEVEYPKDLVVPNMENPADPMVFVLCGFNQEDTPLTKKFDTLLISIKSMTEEIQTYKRNLARQLDLNRLLTEQNVLPELKEAITNAVREAISQYFPRQ